METNKNGNYTERGEIYKHKTYQEAIAMYDKAIKMLDEAITLFENTPWGLPEELDILFGNYQGNENLYTLQKEIDYLKEL